MSRTYRKVVNYTDQGRHSQYYKRLSNKKSRKRELPDGNFYKKNFLTYDICDYKFRHYPYKKPETTEEWLQELGSNYISLYFPREWDMKLHQLKLYVYKDRYLWSRDTIRKLPLDKNKIS